MCSVHWPKADVLKADRMSASERNEGRSTSVPDLKYTLSLGSALDHRSPCACFNLKRLSEHLRAVPHHPVGRDVAPRRPRRRRALPAGDDEQLRLVAVERGNAAGREGNAAGALHGERWLVASLQADGPDIGDECIRSLCDGMLADFP